MKGGGDFPNALRAGAHPTWMLWIGWIIWLPFFVPGMVALVRARPAAPLFAAIVFLLACFVGVYVVGAWKAAEGLLQAHGSNPRAAHVRAASVALLLAMSVAIRVLSARAHAELSSPFIFTSALVGGSFKAARAVPLNAAVLLTALVTGWLLRVDEPEMPLFIIAVVTFVTASWAHAVRTSGLLRAAQAEISHLAVASERLRIARDLHDLLGHRLSLVAIKSELAGRLLSEAPDRAAREIADVEQAARSMLHDVREAVSRYRAPDLAGELRAASEILSASGIALIRDVDDGLASSVSAPLREIAAWAVREGVTNVVRHSRARTCTIRMHAALTDIVLDILDDGSSGSTDMPTDRRTGHGITGLKERTEEIGGRCEAGPQEDGGFRLTVRLPRGKAS